MRVTKCLELHTDLVIVGYPVLFHILAAAMQQHLNFEQGGL